MDALKRSMRWDEERFGREYDLDVFNIVAVSDFNMGAMENKGLNIFNDKYVLADAETATDADFANIEAIIAHEYFHNWTGNRITCRDWFQLCLKEGLTVFRDQEFSADQRSRAGQAHRRGAHAARAPVPRGPGPLAHPVRPRRYREINNFYTATVYEKGSEVCRMMQTILGRDGFRAGMDLYFERHDGEAATIEDFLACFEDATGPDLTQFALWYHQAGTPTVTLSAPLRPGDGAAHARDEAGSARDAGPPAEAADAHPGRLRPGRPGRAGPELSPSASGAAGRRRRHPSRPRAAQEMVFEGVRARPIPSLFREFSAPVQVQSDLTPEDRLFLIGSDPDPFNRWEAAQQIALAMLERATAAIRARRGAGLRSALCRGARPPRRRTTSSIRPSGRSL